MGLAYPDIVVAYDGQHTQIMACKGVELLDVEAGATISVEVENESIGVRKGSTDGVAPALYRVSVSMRATLLSCQDFDRSESNYCGISRLTLPKKPK